MQISDGSDLLEAFPGSHWHGHEVLRRSPPGVDVVNIDQAAFLYASPHSSPNGDLLMTVLAKQVAIRVFAKEAGLAKSSTTTYAFWIEKLLGH